MLPEKGTQERGLLNEIGATQTFGGANGLPDPLGDQEVLMFSVPFRATFTLDVSAVPDRFNAAGGAPTELDVLANDAAGRKLTFSPNAAEGIGHETLVLEKGEESNPIRDNGIVFQSDSVEVRGLEAAAITAVGTPSHGGMVTIINGGTKLQYTPAPGFTGVETFTYTLSSSSTTVEATVTVEVSDPTRSVAPATDPPPSLSVEENPLATPPREATPGEAAGEADEDSMTPVERNRLAGATAIRYAGSLAEQAEFAGAGVLFASVEQRFVIEPLAERVADWEPWRGLDKSSGERGDVVASAASAIRTLPAVKRGSSGSTVLSDAGEFKFEIGSPAAVDAVMTAMTGRSD
jgi:hypothetical protein